MEKAVRLNAEQREDLVAYLDGELPDAQARTIDQIIARSEVARHEVEALARTFELLDALPTVRASEDFATRTLTSLKVMEAPFVLSDQWWFQYLVRTATICCWIFALGGSAWVGFEITRNWIPDRNEAILRDLPIIENLNKYRDAGDIEFLRQLKFSGAFEEPQEK